MTRRARPSRRRPRHVRAAARAGGHRAAGAHASAVATPCGMMVSIGDRAAAPQHGPRPADVAAPGRPRRRQHVGDDAGRHRRHDRRRAGRRRPPVHGAADGPPPRRGPPPRHDGTTCARSERLTPARRCASAGGGTRPPARPDARLGAAVGRHARAAGAAARAPATASAGRSATATCPSRGRSTPTPNSFAREPGSAEMPSAGRVADGRGRHRPRRPRHRRGADRAAHRRRLAGGARDAVPRALPTCRSATARLVNVTHAAAASSSPSARPSCGRWRRSPTRPATVHPGAGWTELVITPERGVRGRRRPAHRVARAGGQPPADARGGRRSAGAASLRTARRSPPAIAGTSSATST